MPLKRFRQIKSIVISIFIALIFILFVTYEFGDSIKFSGFVADMMWLGLASIVFVLAYFVQKIDSKCKQCQEAFTTGLMKTNILSKKKIQEDVEKNGKYIRQAFWVGEKEEIYECENCGHITSKIVKYKEKI